MLLLLFFRLLVVVLLLSDFQIPKTFSVSQPIIIKLRLLIGDNIPNFRTVSDFSVKS